MDLLECKMDKRNSQCEREQPLEQKHLNITEQTLLYSFYGHSHLSVAYADVTKLDHEHAWKHFENSLLVKHCDNQQNRTNLNFSFVITHILTLIKTNQHQNNW